MIKKQNFNGFTMIELLIVIVILGVLMTVGLGNFANSQRKGRDSQRKTDLSNISKALELYYNDKGGYPVSTGDAGILTMNWGEPFVDPLNTSTLYMNVLPSDPQNGTYYYESSDGTDFYLYTRLENTNDRDLNKVGDDVQVYSGTSCTIGTCNYGISSTNVDPSDAHLLVVE